eukprot:TRINITY_DN33365_c0_g1_i1.p1 TRINITY_DN33365_c0_g1~~TRINITY_DN33365_c0_g1_i1.p1  ORF type:complete len:271 (-),score=59.28 TRINITY_DN33365_c0_g1_i1:92-904(-)
MGSKCSTCQACHAEGCSCEECNDELGVLLENLTGQVGHPEQHLLLGETTLLVKSHGAPPKRSTKQGQLSHASSTKEATRFERQRSPKTSGLVTHLSRGVRAPAPSSAAIAEAQKKMPGLVVLNVYDVGSMKDLTVVNDVLRGLGTGAFHAGVEVYGQEFAFEMIVGKDSQPLPASGVYTCLPRGCHHHSYRESVVLGSTRLTRSAVLQAVLKLSEQPGWQSDAYDLLNHNCCHFCQDLCRQLGVGAVPAWVTSAAGMGQSWADLVHLGQS